MDWREIIIGTLISLAVVYLLLLTMRVYARGMIALTVFDVLSPG